MTASSSHPTPDSSRARWPMLIAAALAAAVAAIGIAITNSGGGAQSSASAARQASAELTPITLVAPDGTLKAAPPRFEWRPLAGATLYELKLYADDARVLWSVRGPATLVERPA